MLDQLHRNWQSWNLTFMPTKLGPQRKILALKFCLCSALCSRRYQCSTSVEEADLLISGRSGEENGREILELLIHRVLAGRHM